MMPQGDGEGTVSNGARATLLRGGLSLGSIGFVEAVIGLVTAILLARELGLAGLGTYSIIFALVALGTLVGGFGMPVLVMREIASARARGAVGEIVGVTRFGLLVMAAVCVFGGAMATLAVTVFAIEIPAGVALGLQFGCILIPLTALNNYISGMLLGFHLHGLSRLPEGVVRPAMFLVLILAAGWYLPGSLTPAGAIQLQIAAASASLMASAVLLRFRPRNEREAPPVYRGRYWLKSGISLALIDGLRVIQPQLLILLTSALSTVEAVGLLRLAQRAAGLAGLGSSVVNLTIGPHVASLHALADSDRLQRLATNSARIMTVLLLTGIVVFAAIGVWLIEILLGAEFRQAFAPILIMLGALAVAASFGPTAMLLSMAGAENDVALGYICAMCLGVASSLLLTPSFGAVGAASAAFAATCAESAYQYYRVRARLRIRSSAIGY